MLVLVWPIINATPRQTENIKKEICQIFNRNGLHITIEANKQVVNFLDVTLNLHKSTYQPFTKPNTTLLYVHRESNHPQSITRNIPAGINKRLNPFIWQSILRPSHPSIPRNTQRKRIQLYPSLSFLASMHEYHMQLYRNLQLSMII